MDGLLSAALELALVTAIRYRIVIHKCLYQVPSGLKEVQKRTLVLKINRASFLNRKPVYVDISICF